MLEEPRLGDQVSIMLDGKVVAVFMDGSNCPMVNITAPGCSFLTTVPLSSVVSVRKEKRNEGTNPQSG
jgi:hypothetical protein